MRGDNARRLRAQFRTVTSPEIHRRNHAPANPFPCCIVRVFAAATANMRLQEAFQQIFFSAICCAYDAGPVGTLLTDCA
jgi:hypothetical protein